MVTQISFDIKATHLHHFFS